MINSKTYEIVKDMKEDGELYNKYINREIQLKDISEMYGVTYEHLANVFKENNIGNPKADRRLRTESELLQVERDIDNGLPIDYFKSRYSMFNGLKTDMNLYNSLNNRIRNEEIQPTLPMITLHRLDILVGEINILNIIQHNQKLKKGSKKTLSEIAKSLGVSYTKVAHVASFYKKHPKLLLPNKDTGLVKIAQRNLSISKQVNDSNLTREEAVKEAANKYNLDEVTIERIIECPHYKQEKSN